MVLGICRHFLTVTLAIVPLGVIGAFVTMPLVSLAADLKTIQQQGRLIVAVKDNLRPLGFRGADNQLRGLEIEIAQRLAQELLGPKGTVVLKPVLNQDRLSVLMNGQVDVVIARMTATESRSRLVSFSIPYYFDGTALVTKASTIQRVQEAATGTIAVLENSDTIAAVRYRFPKATLIGMASYAAAQAALDRGDAIAFAADASVLSGWVQEFPGYRLLGPSLTVEPLCIVVPKGLQYDELRRQINASLDRWYAEGWLQERAAYWGLP